MEDHMRPLEVFLIFSLVLNLILYEAKRDVDRAFAIQGEITTDFYNKIKELEHEQFFIK